MRADVRKSPGTDMDPASRILRRVRIQDVQLPAAKVSNPKFRGKVWKFPRYFKGHLPIGNVQVRILPGQPTSPASGDLPSVTSEMPANGGLLRIGYRSPGSQIGRCGSQIADSLRQIFEIFPFSGDSGRRPGSIGTAWRDAQCAKIGFGCAGALNRA
jgi:hypothetical protein